MRPSVSTSTLVPPECEVTSVETVQGYLGMLDAILEVCRQAEREDEAQPPAPSGDAILALCRERAGGHLKRMAHPHPTTWEMGLAELLEGLWDTLYPVPGVSEAELMRRVQKARRLAGTLAKLFAPIIVMESVYPVEIEAALSRYYDSEADGYIPF